MSDTLRTLKEGVKDIVINTASNFKSDVFSYIGEQIKTNGVMKEKIDENKVEANKVNEEVKKQVKIPIKNTITNTIKNTIKNKITKTEAYESDTSSIFGETFDKVWSIIQMVGWVIMVFLSAILVANDMIVYPVPIRVVFFIFVLLAGVFQETVIKLILLYYSGIAVFRWQINKKSEVKKKLKPVLFGMLPVIKMFARDGPTPNTPQRNTWEWWKLKFAFLFTYYPEKKVKIKTETAKPETAKPETAKNLTHKGGNNKTNQVEEPQVKATQVEATQVEATQVEATQVEENTVQPQRLSEFLKEENKYSTEKEYKSILPIIAQDYWDSLIYSFDKYEKVKKNTKLIKKIEEAKKYLKSEFFKISAETKNDGVKTTVVKDTQPAFIFKEPKPKIFNIGNPATLGSMTIHNATRLSKATPPDANPQSPEAQAKLKLEQAAAKLKPS